MSKPTYRFSHSSPDGLIYYWIGPNDSNHAEFAVCSRAWFWRTAATATATATAPKAA